MNVKPSEPGDLPRSRRRKRSRRPIETSPSLSGQRILGFGGNQNFLEESVSRKIHNTSIELLSEIGMDSPPQSAINLVEDAGGCLSVDNRLKFPQTLVEEALKNVKRNFTLFGRVESVSLDLTQGLVHVGTGGASPSIYESEKKCFRQSNLTDLYDAARLADTLTHNHFFSRSLVACDITLPVQLDINTAFACLAGTRKHVMASASCAESVRNISTLCYQLAGSEANFRARPFLSLNVNHAVPPLRFDSDSVDVLITAVRSGIPVFVNTFGQLGASSPVHIAGCVAQTVAETLAGLVLAWLSDKECLAIFGPRPMVTDLRTGGMAGGSGEQASLTATAINMAQYYNLPCSTIAGATDSKISDAQSGYEKCLSISRAVNAGANIITHACGSQASLMGVSYESMVIDNDMLGCILRSTNPIEISDDTLSAEAIGLSATGQGHFLGASDTYARMHSDFLYPNIANRKSIELWESDGRKNIWQAASETVKHTFMTHHPYYIDKINDRILREKFDIVLPQSNNHSPTDCFYD